MRADAQLIHWLLFDSGESMYSVSQKTGFPASTLSRIKNEHMNIESLSFENASKLTKYAKELRKCSN